MSPNLLFIVAAMGGVFALTECAAEGIRGESDPYNAGIAGCAAGLVAGVRCTATTFLYHK